MFKCVVISLLEIKSFVSLKIESLLFWTRVHFKGGVKFSGAKGVRSIFQGGADTLEDTLISFLMISGGIEVD